MPFSVVGIPSGRHEGRDRLHGARANVDTAHVLFHLTVLLPPTGRVCMATMACVLYQRPKRSDRSGHRPTVEPGRFAMPTSRAFHICVNGVSGGDVQGKIISFS